MSLSLYELMLEKLEGLSEEELLKTGKGLCSTFDYPDYGSLHAEGELRKLFPLWTHFSGDTTFPINSPSLASHDFHLSVVGQFLHVSNHCRLKDEDCPAVNKYLELRLDLLEFLKKELRSKIKNLKYADEIRLLFALESLDEFKVIKNGICFEVGESLEKTESDLLFLRRAGNKLRKLFTEWEHFSGDSIHPISVTNRTDPMTQFDTVELLLRKADSIEDYKGDPFFMEYITKRLELLWFVKDELRGIINGQ